MSEVTHSVSISTPFTVGSLCSLAKELSGLAADREVLLSVTLQDNDDFKDPVEFDTAWAKLSVEF